MKQITFKAVNNMGSCWIKPLATLHTTYRSGRTFRGKHPELPLFAIDPKQVALNTRDLHFTIGAEQTDLLVVEYDKKDVAGFSPWAHWPCNQSADVATVSVEKIAGVVEKNLSANGSAFCLHKLRVLCKVDRKRFTNAAEALAFYQKKYLKK